MHRKIYYREFYLNIIKMFMNNVIILLLAVRICEDSDNRGSDKRGCTVCTKKIVIERTRDLIYLKFVAIDFFPKINSPSAGKNSGDLA